MVKVRWWGHACFEVKGSKVTVVLDPHGGSVGLPEPDVKGDIVLASHGHFDHATGIDDVAAPGAEKLVGFTGEKTVKEVRIKGIASYHDPKKGALRGENSIYVFEVDEVKFCHLGDLGHVPSSEQVEEIGEVHVLFIPVGGVYTINAKEATETVNLIKPRIVVPMHYKVPGLTVDVNGVDAFLKGKSNVKQIGGPEFEVNAESLPAETEIWVLSL